MALEPGLIGDITHVVTEEDTAVTYASGLVPTPVGMEVRVRAELLEADGRRLQFRVEAWDAVEKIGECDHERFIIDWERFIGRIEEKEAASAGTD